MNHNIMKLIIYKCNKFVLAFFIKNNIEIKYASYLLVIRTEFTNICYTHEKKYTNMICNQCNTYAEECKSCKSYCSICLKTNMCSSCNKPCSNKFCYRHVCKNCEKTYKVTKCTDCVMICNDPTVADICNICDTTYMDQTYNCFNCKFQACYNCVFNKKFKYSDHLDKCLFHEQNS